MAQPTVQSIGTAVGGIGAITVAWPAGHAANDIALLFVECDGAGVPSLTTPAGFQLLDKAASGSAAADTQIVVYWCRATSGAMGNVTVADTGDHTYGVILTVSGCVTSGNPWAFYAGRGQTPATTTMTAFSIGPAVLGQDYLCIVACARALDSAAAAMSAWTNSGGIVYNEIFDAGITSGNGGGLGIAYGGWTPTADGDFTSGVSATVTSSILANIHIVLVGQQPTTSQPAYRFYEDGTETAATAIAAQNTNISRAVDSNSNLLLRVRLQYTGGIAGSSTDDFRLQYSLSGGTYTNVGSGAVIGYDSASLTHGSATTNQLGSGSGAFVAGEIAETSLVTDRLITSNNYSEFLFAMTLVSSAVANGDTIDFRLLRNEVVLDTYTVTPRINVTKTGGGPTDDQSSFFIFF